MEPVRHMVKNRHVFDDTKACIVPEVLLEKSNLGDAERCQLWYSCQLMVKLTCWRQLQEEDLERQDYSRYADYKLLLEPQQVWDSRQSRREP